MLGRLGFSAALLALIAAIVIPTATASAPIHEDFVFSDITFEDFYLSDACGTTVLDTVNVSVSVTFFPAAHGSPANEVDTLNGSITYSSPDTGNSLTRPMNGTSQAVYPEGIAPGSPAHFTITGVNTSSLTGTAPPGSGQLVADGTILFLDDLGVPITTFETSGILSRRGSIRSSTPPGAWRSRMRSARSARFWPTRPRQTLKTKRSVSREWSRCRRAGPRLRA